MNIAKYTFISPYPSPVQVGRLDPSSVQESNSENMKQGAKPPALSSEAQQLKELQIVNKSENKSADSTLSNSFLLDIYA